MRSPNSFPAFGWTNRAGHAGHCRLVGKKIRPRRCGPQRFWVPTDDKPLEISVTTLPWRGTQDELLSNVNRWRGQLQLPAIEAPGLAEVTRELDAGDAKMTLVDLRGQFQGSGMMGGPFAGGAGAASRCGTTVRPNELPAGHPPIDASNQSQSAAPPRAASDPSLPEFEVPQSWQQRPPASAHAQGRVRASPTAKSKRS